MEPMEIERKYLIAMPDAAFLSGLSSSSIEQIYLLSEDGMNARIRRRSYSDRTVCTHTRKKRISDMSRIEIEHEISEREYEELRQSADPARRVIKKIRYLYPYEGQCFEIDVFPFWTDRALMELELESEGQRINLPPAIEVIRDVTSDRRYTNSAIAREIP